MSGRLHGRRSLVTGAATGIGRATSERLAAEGAEVVLFGLGGAELEAVAESVGGIAVHGDVTDRADIAKAVAACGGRIDVLVNAAGIVSLDHPLEVVDETWERVFAVNLTAIVAICRSVVPKMIQGGGGAVVNIASVAAFNSSPATTSYAASKAALVSYTRSLAFAHGPDGIRANVVAPGWVRTPMSEMEMRMRADFIGTTKEEEFEALARNISLRRVARPEEIAACCAFLASDDASYVNGSVLVADGGGRSPTNNRAA